MKKYYLRNLDCASCASKIEKGVKTLREVRFVSVNFARLTMIIDTDDIAKVKNKIREIEPEVEVEEIDSKKGLISAHEISENRWTIAKIATALCLMLLGVFFKESLQNTPYQSGELLVMISAYLIAGWNVLTAAIRNIIKGRIFSEHFLMTIATLGAYAIDEATEAVAVMLFYVVGELLQDIAVGRSRKSITALLEIKPRYANLLSGSEIIQVSPDAVKKDDIIIVRAGEKIPLDGYVMEGESFVDTAALTGESLPRSVRKGDEILAGMINQSGMLTIKVGKIFSESSVSRILEMVENATSKKAETEKFITTFARYYTPVVVFLAALLATVPPLIIPGAVFNVWLYRALVVLVVSCPCALVISIPLGYFGGIGNASRRGILVKGSNFLDALSEVETVVFDKTGTLTKGEFIVAQVTANQGYAKEDLLEYAAYAESNSNHPLAKSIIKAFGNKINHSRINFINEISGRGIAAGIDGKMVSIGSTRLMRENNIMVPDNPEEGNIIHVAIDKKYAGCIIISDSLKEESVVALEKLKAKGIKTAMFTGDNFISASSIAGKLGIERFHAELLPEDKVQHLENFIRETKGGKVAFVGDGINDAPVIARADIGIAMGALGSDAAIETADVVLMTDSPNKLIEAIEVAKLTKSVVWQNIFFALGVKILFVVMGILGIATLWEAVFGDMGVALIAVFNAMRVLRKS